MVSKRRGTLILQKMLGLSPFVDSNFETSKTNANLFNTKNFYIRPLKPQASQSALTGSIDASHTISPLTSSQDRPPTESATGQFFKCRKN